MDTLEDKGDRFRRTVRQRTERNYASPVPRCGEAMIRYDYPIASAPVSRFLGAA